MKSNRLVVALLSVGALEEYVLRRLCEQHRWEPDQTTMRRHLIRQANQVSGMLMQVEGPRAHKGMAIWAGWENRVIFYDTAGARFAEVHLSEAPDPAVLAMN